MFIDNVQIEKEGINYLGNTHGGLLFLDNRWYIFYHRQTNRHSYSRQACAEELKLNKSGDFMQAEVTSCGLNKLPLFGSGQYRSNIACNLRSAKVVARYDIFLSKIRLFRHPYITQSGIDGDPRSKQYISNIRHGTVIGFTYFDFNRLNNISINIRGNSKGRILVSANKEFDHIISFLDIEINSKINWVNLKSESLALKGVYPLYFKFMGKGSVEFNYFELIRN